MLKYITIVIFAVMIVMNWLANALPMNNVTTGQLSNSYPNLFVPAGITFSIWGIIYLLLALYCVVQFTTPSQKEVSVIALPFAVTCLLNGLWIVAWHYRQLPLSLLIMLGLLALLIYINMSVKHLPFGIIKSAFGIYLGWICIATIANVTALLVNMNLRGYLLSEEVWTIVMIAAGTLIVAITIYRLENPFIGLSVIWAFTGIIIKRQDDYKSILYAALAGALIETVITVIAFLRKSFTS